MASTPTIFTSVPGTSEPTLLIRDIHRPSCQVQTIPTPALTSVFNTGVLVHPAIREAFPDRHVGSVVFYLGGEETARGRLGVAGVVGEVGVSVGGDRRSGVGGYLRGCG
jgi:hypothetical protein